jgi:hypothetical protein
MSGRTAEPWNKMIYIESKKNYGDVSRELASAAAAIKSDNKIEFNSFINRKNVAPNVEQKG